MTATVAAMRRQKTIRAHSAPWRETQQDMFQVYDQCMQAELFGDKGLAKLTRQHRIRRQALCSSRSALTKFAAVEAHRAEFFARQAEKAEKAAQLSSDVGDSLGCRSASQPSLPSGFLPTATISPFFPTELTVDTRERPRRLTEAPSEPLSPWSDPASPFSAGTASPISPDAARRRTLRKSKTSRIAEEPVEIPVEEFKRREKHLQILRRCKFFQELQALDKTAMKELAIVAADAELRKGRVVFCQHDQPRSCYIIVEGSVGIYVKNPGAVEPAAVREREGAIKAKPAPRQTTFEGFSSYSRQDWIGGWVTTLGPGDLFGELALLNNDMRAATVKCLEPCVFLEVQKAAFEQAIKADLLRQSYERMQFFEAHVPGFANIFPIPNVHPTYFWHRHSYNKGHCFLAEGSVVEPTVWAITAGKVALTRREWIKGEESATLSDGEVFCSMATVPFLAAEPFTITVTSESCVVFYLSCDCFIKITSEGCEPVLTALRKHLRHDMTKRVRNLCIKSTFGREPMQSPRAAGFPDWREAPATAHRNEISRPSSNPLLAEDSGLNTSFLWTSTNIVSHRPESRCSFLSPGP